MVKVEHLASCLLWFIASHKSHLEVGISCTLLSRNIPRHQSVSQSVSPRPDLALRQMSFAVRALFPPSPLMLWPPYGQFLFPPSADRVARCFHSPKAKKKCLAFPSPPLQNSLFSFPARHMNSFETTKSSLCCLLLHAIALSTKKRTNQTQFLLCKCGLLWES